MDKILQKYFIKKANEEVPEPTYVGIFLDSSSQEELFKHGTLPDKNSGKCAHHITILSPTYKGKKELYKEFLPLLGKEVSLTVTEIIQGKAEDKKNPGMIEAALVESLPAGIPYYNDSYKHITLSRENEKVAPHHAGKIKDPTNTTTVSVRVKGKVGFFYGAGDEGRIGYSEASCKNPGHVEEVKESEKQTGVTKLVICDFDGTLFNSPHPPANKGWGKPVTLSVESFVNGQADVEAGFNKKVLAAMKGYESDPSAYSVLLTGRPTPMKDYVKKIIGSKVKFKEEHFSTGGGTEEFKKGVIDMLLKKLPDVKEVEIWEDRKEHEAAFLKHVKEKGLKAEPGQFTVEEPIKLKPEVIAELENQLAERKKREEAEAKAKAEKEQAAANRAIPVAYALVPESQDVSGGIEHSSLTIADAGQINAARVKFFKDPTYEDLKLVIVNLPQNKSLDSFKGGKVPASDCDVKTKPKKKPEAA